MYCNKAVWRVLQLSTSIIAVTKNNDYIFYTVSSFNCIWLEQKQDTVSPVFVEIRQKIQPQRGSCNCVLYTSEGKHTVGSRWFTQPASGNITTLNTHLCLRKGGKRKIKCPISLTSPISFLQIYEFLINLAFKPLPDSLEKYDILSVCGVTNSHLSTPVLSAGAVAAWSPPVFPHYSLESGDFSSGRPLLRFQGSSLA